jgi:3-(3-hydroxy-phenyl)propionate hydroxylase
VLLRVPDFWRVLVPTEIGISDEDLLSDAKKNAVFDGLMGNGASVETNHRTLYRVHQRVAESFHHGRVVLVGDAAHLNNPLGGFGMNSGIHDVWNLTNKLQDILLDGADAQPALALYDRQRRAIAHSFVQTQTIANKKMLESDDGRSEKEAQLAAIAQDPDKRRAYMLHQSMVASLREEATIQ